MNKLGIHYTAMRRNPGVLKCTTSNNTDPFWQGRRFCSIYNEFSQTYSIKSFENGRQEYLISKKNSGKVKPTIIKTTVCKN
jgi:hypothetical protein